MKNRTILFIVLLIVISGVGYWAFGLRPKATQNFTLDPQNCAYTIEGKSVILQDGYAEEEIAPLSLVKAITRYFGNTAQGDFNADGLTDVAFILTQDPGGSGTFFYAAVALNGKDKCLGTNTILLGDRIAPQTTEFRDGEIIINYADRNPGEPMTAQPSLGVSKYLQVSGGNLVEIQK